VSRRPRHGYAADLPVACRHVMNDAHRKFPPRQYQRDAPHPAQIRQVRAGGVCQGRNTGSSSGAPSRESKAKPGSADSQALAVAPGSAR
jgi:hypothetical protein